MSKRMISIAIAVVVILFAYWWWSNHRDTFGSGNVTSSDPAARMDGGSVDLDGKPMPEGTLSSTSNNAADTGQPHPKSDSSATAGPGGVTAPSGATASSGGVNNTPVRTTPGPVTTVPVETPVAVSQPYTNVATNNGDLPAGDTLTPSAPAGMAFGGSGKFQWYRQGNLTWRINTQSGSSCIAFATMDEWQKPIVYQHGCGNA